MPTPQPRVECGGSDVASRCKGTSALCAIDNATLSAQQTILIMYEEMSNGAWFTDGRPRRKPHTRRNSAFFILDRYEILRAARYPIIEAEVRPDLSRRVTQPLAGISP